MPHVSALAVYPVKSFAGNPLDEMTVDASGPRGDRRWMLVDESGETLTARKFPAMLGARATPVAGGGVRLTARDREPLDVAEPAGPADVSVRMSRLTTATSAGAEADAWCSALVGRPARLLWLDDPARRGMSDKHGGTLDDPMSLNDSGPLHVTTTASLARLESWAAELHDERVERALAAGDPAPEPRQALDMRRFRPNLVLDGDLEAFAEDRWATLTVGEVELRFADLCGRCVMTTVDPDTQVKSREPLLTLARHRRWDGELWFGIQMVPVRTGRIAVGDPVETTSR